MGLFKNIGKAVKKVGKAVASSPIGKLMTPALQVGASFIPGLSTVASIVSFSSSAIASVKGSDKKKTVAVEILAGATNTDAGARSPVSIKNSGVLVQKYDADTQKIKKGR